MIELREYQKEPVKVAIDFLKLKKRQSPSLLVLPTAWGKSILIGWVANKLQEKILVIQPTKELLEQNYWKYITLCKDETTASVYSASFDSKEVSQVTFCTIGSIKSKGKDFRSLGFKKVLIDEAHMYPREDSGMLKTFIKDLHPSHVLGVTATPFKLQTNTDMSGNPFSKLVCLTNRSKKGSFFRDILYVSQIEEMVQKGFWSKLEYFQEPINSSNLTFNSTKAEYTENSVEKCFTENQIKTKIIEGLDHLINQGKYNHILVFVPSVKIAIELQKKCGGSIVFSGMKDKEREQNIQDFKTGKTTHIFNVRILSVGFDYTKIDAIILGYPMASLTAYYQIIGRGTRIHPGKESCFIYDLGGNYSRFGKIETLKLVELAGFWEMIQMNKMVTSVPIHLLNNPYSLHFGKYKNLPLKEVPTDYLKWVLENVEVDNLTKKYIHLEFLNRNEKTVI